MNKNEQRKNSRKILGTLSETERENGSGIIFEKIISSEIFKKSRTVFVYVSTESEPDTLRLIDYAIESGKSVCVPKCVSKTEMKAVRINSLNELSEGKFGIMEPADMKKSIDKSEIDLAVIPCVAASNSRKRLGHGAGYYDRFLENMTAYKMCLCFKELVFEDIPTDEHDIIMDEIVSG